MRSANSEILYIDLAEAVKQVHGDKKCMGISASMAFDESIEQWENFLKSIYSAFTFIRVDAPWGLKELKLYALAHGKDIEIKKENTGGPAIVVVHSEHYKNVLHAIYLDENSFIHDPNPDSDDGRDISTYRVVKFYKIVPFVNDE